MPSEILSQSHFNVSVHNVATCCHAGPFNKDLLHNRSPDASSHVGGQQVRIEVQGVSPPGGNLLVYSSRVGKTPETTDHRTSSAPAVLCMVAVTIFS